MCCFERPVAIVVMDDDAGKETAIVENFWPQVGAQLSYPNDRGRRFLEVGCADHREVKRADFDVFTDAIFKAKDGTYHAYILELAVYGIQDVTRARTTMYLMRPEPSSVPTYLPQLRMEVGVLELEPRQNVASALIINSGIRIARFSIFFELNFGKLHQILFFFS